MKKLNYNSGWKVTFVGKETMFRDIILGGEMGLGFYVILKPGETMTLNVQMHILESLNTKKKPCKTHVSKKDNAGIFHDIFYERFGCTYPYFGGFKTNLTMCLDPSIYEPR